MIDTNLRSLEEEVNYLRKWSIQLAITMDSTSQKIVTNAYVEKTDEFYSKLYGGLRK